MKTQMVLTIAALGFSLFTIGCATTGPGPRYSDTEVEMAMRQTEDETLARLATSNNNDIADTATTLARDLVTR